MAKKITQPAVPKPTEAAQAPTAIPVKKKGMSFSPNLMVFVCVCLVLGYLAFASWQALEIDTSADNTQTAGAPNVPKLKLNQENERQGPSIKVDEENIGKENPFE